MSAAAVVRDFDALVAFLDQNLRTPFAWGEFDCVIFAARAVEALTGVDRLADATSRKWRTARGAARALAAAGGLEAAVDGVLPKISPAFAHRGDVALVEVEGRASLCIFEGDSIVGPGEVGLVRLPRLAASCAWSAL